METWAAGADRWFAGEALATPEVADRDAALVYTAPDGISVRIEALAGESELDTLRRVVVGLAIDLSRATPRAEHDVRTPADRRLGFAPHPIRPRETSAGHSGAGRTRSPVWPGWRVWAIHEQLGPSRIKGGSADPPAEPRGPACGEDRLVDHDPVLARFVCLVCA